MLSSTELRRRIEVQGFTGLSDAQIHDVAPWMRFTPLLNGLLVGLSTMTGSVVMLLAMAGVMLLGAVSDRHPFDRLYNRFIRPLENSPELPRSGWRRRLVFGGGALWLAGLAALFISGHALPARALGMASTGLIALLAAAYICVPSEAMDRMFGTPGKRGE